MTKINLTPIIDVVFILLIFFMLATNFQKFSKTDINLSSETASISQSEKKIFLIEFEGNNKFLLNDEELPYDTIKKTILNSNLNEDEYLVVAKPSEETNLQQTLDIIADLTRSKIKNISLGIINPKIKRLSNETTNNKIKN